MAALAREFAAFINATPTPFQLVGVTAEKLRRAAFVQLNEADVWTGGALKPGGKYFFWRNHSTLVAFTIGGKYTAGNGFKVIGAHTDSPVLKLKPISKKSAHGYLQVGVECYGGGLWHTWFDRELTIAGSIIVKTGSGFERRLVHVPRPLLRIPTLCIHLQSADERDKFSPNKETQLVPILAMVEAQLNAPKQAAEDEPKEKALDARHAPELLRLLADEVKCAAEDITDFELSLADTQPAQIWGLRDEFISSPRLDNQVHCFTALEALLSHSGDEAWLLEDHDVSVIALFDHEEVGSQSSSGAGSTVMQDALTRITDALAPTSEHASQLYRVAMQKSFCISADVAHAVHPNYSSKHEDHHRPLLNGGTVIKTNDNQRYATNSVTGFVIRELARKAEVPIQEFMVRNDCPCGTTIGPILSERLGLRTVDVGIPSLSMHSIRETIGVADISHSKKLFLEFFRSFRELDASCKFD